jgi:phage tail protein X
MTNKSIQYRSIQGDTVDFICWHYYGKTTGVLEKVLEANPTLAEYGPVLPVGTLVELPSLSTQVTANTEVLWA